MEQTKFTYSIKICRNKEKIREFLICDKCGVGNNIKRLRCVNCFGKLGNK